MSRQHEQEISRMPEYRFRRGASSVSELVALFAVVAGNRAWTDNRKSWIARGARRAGISPRQAKAIFYGEITDPRHRSARLVRDAAAAHYEQIAESLARRDPEFYSAEIASYRDLAGSLRRLDRSTVTKPGVE
jgi:hypothetical protein